MLVVWTAEGSAARLVAELPVDRVTGVRIHLSESVVALPLSTHYASGNLAERPGIQSFHGKQWYQAHHGASLQRHGLASR